MKDSAQKAVSARVNKGIFNVISVQDRGQSTLKRHTKSVTHTVVSIFGHILNYTITIDRDWKASTSVRKRKGNALSEWLSIDNKKFETNTDDPLTATLMLPSLSSLYSTFIHLITRSNIDGVFSVSTHLPKNCYSKVRVKKEQFNT